jgi:hypothetical protein
MDTHAVKILIPHNTAKLLWIEFVNNCVAKNGVDVYKLLPSDQYPFDKLAFVNTIPVEMAQLTIYNIYCDAEHNKIYYVPVQLLRSCLSEPPVATKERQGYEALLTSGIIYAEDHQILHNAIQLGNMQWGAESHQDPFVILQAMLQAMAATNMNLRLAVTTFYSLPMPRFTLPVLKHYLTYSQDHMPPQMSQEKERPKQ